MTLNVSGGGLLLTGVSGLQEGDSAFVAIDLEDGSPPVEALVTVVRIAERNSRAVRIASISARDEQRIVRFAFARERQARIARDG
jgi:c-di-GMP-binding flagellar brake protein YcgR